MNAMFANQGVTAYKQVNRFSGIEAASPHELIEMLLKGALDKIAIAKGYMVRKSVARKGEEISKSIAIVQELRLSINLESGGTLAQRLDNLYDYIVRTLMVANMENDTDKLDEVTSLLSEIYTSWVQIPEELRR